ncbi:glycoside hydrolase family 76 protein [Nocardia sp. NPDC059240]|uniref:glycoside hydrolase family 76 protein n=1 Tax=Nocardia sp. NPDC059240 TaxID=3346786 RepID=UPI00369E7BB9
MGSGGRAGWGVAALVLVVAAILLVVQPYSARESVAPGTVTLQVRQWSRVIALNAVEDMATATIGNGQPGDSVWLDRRGDRAASASRLETVTVAAGSTAAHTQPHSYAGGVLRACGKAADRPEIRCSRWIGSQEPPPDRRTRALERLLDRYDHDTGLWENDASTWQSADALIAVIDYMARTGDRQYLGYLDETYRHGSVSRTGVPRDTGYNDDELWWAWAWVRAFDLTGDSRYLDAARAIADRADTQRAASCGGGLRWARTGIDPQLHPWTQVNTITNGLYLTVTALLSTRVESASRPGYLGRAQQAWQWFTRQHGHALFDGSGLIDDHLDIDADNSCGVTDPGTRWTYDQGVMMSALAALYRATGSRDLLGAADAIAAATTGPGSPFLQAGLLGEPAATDCPGPACHDAEVFKGVFVRSYRELLDTGHSRTVTADFLNRQADTLTGVDDEYGFRWQPLPQPDDRPNFATQTAALDALDAQSP